MGLDLWFRDDVRAILRSVQATHRTARERCPALDEDHARAYDEGYGDALANIAIAFGLSQLDITAWICREER